MNVDDYQQEAMSLLNPALNPQDVLENALMGLCGESGEAIDLLKKHRFQGHPLDKEKLKKEAWRRRVVLSGGGAGAECAAERNFAGES